MGTHGEREKIYSTVYGGSVDGISAVFPYLLIRVYFNACPLMYGYYILLLTGISTKAPWSSKHFITSSDKLRQAM